MTILVVSDNHGDRERLTELKRKYAGQVEAMFHCGDSELSFDSAEMDGFIKVRGNCDMDSSYPEDETVAVGGKTVFMTHGHLYGIKQSLQRIAYKAEEEKADLIFFGHSHQLGAERLNGRLFLNPGSILLPRGRKEATYALVDWQDDQYTVAFYTHDHELVTKEVL